MHLIIDVEQCRSYPFLEYLYYAFNDWCRTIHRKWSVFKEFIALKKLLALAKEKKKNHHLCRISDEINLYSSNGLHRNLQVWLILPTWSHFRATVQWRKWLENPVSLYSINFSIYLTVIFRSPIRYHGVLSTFKKQ